jgi:hypothetical protein
MKLSDLKRNPENPFPFKSEGERKILIEKIKEDPEFLNLRPIVYDAENDNVILGGNKRHEVLEALGYDEIPDDWAIPAEGLTEVQKRKFIFADNINYGEWSADFVSVEEDDEWGLMVSFEDQEFAKHDSSGNVFEYGEEDLPESHIKMVQLYLTTETHPEFMKMADALKEKYKTNSITDTVFLALKNLVDD